MTVQLSPKCVFPLYVVVRYLVKRAFRKISSLQVFLNKRGRVLENLSGRGETMFEAGEKSKILVVEDDTAIRQVLCIYLRYAGYEVETATNGQDAICIIPEFCPQLIVLDLMMQPVDGWEVLEWLRTNQESSPIPVLVLTARTHLTEQVHGFEAGAVEYVTKPTQPS